MSKAFAVVGVLFALSFFLWMFVTDFIPAYRAYKTHYSIEGVK